MNEGFKKIDLDSGPDSLSQSVSKNSQPEGKSSEPMRRRFPKLGKRKLGIIGLIILVLGLVTLYSAFGAFKVLADSKKFYSQVKLASDAAKKQNVILAREELVKSREAAEKLKRELKTIGFLKFVPGAGAYYSDGEHLINAGIHGINAAIIVTDSLIPYADVLGLKGEKSFVGGSAEERIRTAIKTMGKVVPKIDDIEIEIKRAKEEVDKVNPSRYPNFWAFKKLRNQISLARAIVDEGALAVEQGKPLIKLLPELLGDKKTNKYLVLFQNDNELRPTGGFLTYYSIFRVEEGVIHIDSSNDIYRLDDSIRSHPQAPAMILKYLPKVSTFNIRDSNLSPDFVESMKTFRDFYEKSSLKTEIDGIIAIDTDFLVHIIDILGEVQAAGQTFTAKTDPRCNCPQVVYQLELNTTKPVGFVRENRKAIVGELLYATMQKALQSSPKLYWGPLFQKAIEDAAEKHILFDLNNKDAQRGIEALNWGGRIKSFEGDYLHINDANFAGAKSNMYIKQSIRVDYDVSSNGEISKTVAIEYRNPEKHSDCNLERGGLCLNATLRNVQRVYVSQGSVLTASKGSEVKVETKKELGKTYFESFFTVKPLGKSAITYTYKLPFKVSKGVLPLLIQKQAGVEVVPVEVYLNGKKTESFDLRTDKVINLKLAGN
ncbi:MAG: hypothetical protein A3C27_02130 [Candidatus Levybacteria bacterium RIFCSPHIGHO2_02_FULL_39_36]|nr:MAG: hypothetical protein UT20_C0016G0012 [Candidatus Levybacteria bacterium GW2011_GWA1_39_11]KKR24863.1 MAG: hypothetical protein UT56_C0007G0031 [Candidatus Levybacteria bacterium GW2011_GWB1_39_7]KKR27077.1 MAG: hypothetical protein UT57_C0020G0004 [Microgenomates group bacterium GW2011_GWC1_39_7]KKR50104.1 MAG: hypothetical protein UT85_C0006G0033 [Candidatus Levybacteria bacterium GW2011_GWA2_40_16]OGH15556.1 MAG: hypothetical protein A2689_00850 [Candidatus Levybacteria bacterium RIFC